MKSYVPSRIVRLGFSFLRKLIGRGAVPVNLIVANGVAVLAHRIARVTFYGVDTAILDFLYKSRGRGTPSPFWPVSNPRGACTAAAPAYAPAGGGVGLKSAYGCSP